MGQKKAITASFNLPDGREVTIETGKLATLADGSVVVRVGKTMLFCSAVSATSAREGQSFFPLSVDYQEKFAAAGRIPGNFFRREARLSEREILTSRLVDRAIRPLFPKGYMHDTQIIINLISGDLQELPEAYAALAASAAMTCSDIPFEGPISEVRVAKVDGEHVINPTREQLETAELELIVAATMDDVMMVEGEANECSEQDIVDAIRAAHEAIKPQIEAQLELKKAANSPENREVDIHQVDDALVTEIEAIVKDDIVKIASGAHNKGDRKAGFGEIKDALKEKLTEEKGEEWIEENWSDAKEALDKIKKNLIRRMVLDTGNRLDGRTGNVVRDIWCEVDYLPSAHGSAIFTRGETQSLTSLTLGSKKDRQMIDDALDFHYNDFILHYNFPAYSVGETKPMRGPGRREIGHANLAGRSLKKVLPDEFPYVLRIVSDIMESNGSSSMATVCAGSLAMMDAGIQIKKPVAGIAMGLISDGEKTVVLSDILGDEDALGDMDFKLTGTEDGITACQMDIKIKGLPYETLIAALEQARDGRLHILGEMAKEMAAPREDYKPHAPRMEEIRIPKEFIGAVIGPGGKVIQEMQAETDTVINIEEEGDEGIVSISGTNPEGIKAALAKIADITFKPQVGDDFTGKVDRIEPYGVFVQFRGQSGLLHVSEMSWSRIENVEDEFELGDEVEFKVIEVDDRGKIRISRKALMPSPDGREYSIEDSQKPRGRGGDRRGGGRRDDRRGGGGGGRGRGGDRRGGGGGGRRRD